MTEQRQTDLAQYREGMREMGAQLAAAREAMGLTMQDVANLSHGELKEGTVKALEQGKRYASTQNLIAYTQILGVMVIIVPNVE